MARSLKSGGIVRRLSIGLDIGTSAVRAAELNIGPSVPELLTYGQVSLAPGVVVDGEIKETEAVTAAIEKLWKLGGFSGTSVVVGVAGLRAITREIDIPFVPDDEVDSAVRFQSEEVMPFPPDQTLLSSQVLSDFTNPEGDKLRRVLVAAAHTQLVDGVISAVEAANLTVTGVDLISSAVVRSVGDRSDPEHPEAVVSFGAGLTMVTIHQHGQPQFVRTIGVGGNATTSAISGALDLPLADAEAVKRRIGEQANQMQLAEQAALPTMLDQIGEVRNSIQYFASLPGRLPVSRIIVTGGGSQLHGMIQMLQDQTGLPVIPVSPLERVNAASLQLTPEQAHVVSPILSGPIGIALPEPDKAIKKFNLLPPEVAKRARIAMIQKKTIMASAAVLVLTVGYGAWKFYQVHNAQNTTASIQSAIASLNAQVPKYDQVVAANTAYTAGLARRSSVMTSAVDWPQALTSLIAITPPGAQVQSFEGTSTATTTTPGTANSSTLAASIGTIQLNVTGPGPGLNISEDWINAVAGSPLFANPVQGATAVNSNGTISFPFTVSVTPQASLDKNASLR